MVRLTRKLKNLKPKEALILALILAVVTAGSYIQQQYLGYTNLSPLESSTQPADTGQDYLEGIYPSPTTQAAIEQAKDQEELSIKHASERREIWELIAGTRSTDGSIQDASGTSHYLGYAPLSLNDAEAHRLHAVEQGNILYGDNVNAHTAFEAMSSLKPGEVRYEYDPRHKKQRVLARLTSKNIQEGKRARADISDIHPLGWPTHNYETQIYSSRQTIPDKQGNNFVYSGWLWNRSHLLAHSLGGLDEEKNLITGTRQQNVGFGPNDGGMLALEKDVAHYLRINPDHEVIYVVTPSYGPNAIPPLVYADVVKYDPRYVAKQLTQGDGLDFHPRDVTNPDDMSATRYIVTNTAPGFDIDYARRRWNHLNKIA